MGRCRTSRTEAVGQDQSDRTGVWSRTGAFIRPCPSDSTSLAYPANLPQGEVVRHLPSRSQFALVIQAPDSGDAAIRRLRAFLKMALRSFGLRCVRVEPATPNQTGDAT